MQESEFSKSSDQGLLSGQKETEQPTKSEDSLKSPVFQSQSIRKDIKGAGDVKPKQMAYRAATPYPPVKAACKNTRYASAILDNLGGQLSEMTAIGQYVYSNFLTRDYPEIADTFHHISIVEMYHMEIFGLLAMQLGADPRLWTKNLRTGRYIYWNAGYIRCSCSVRDLLSLAITSERQACSKYLKQASWIQDTNVCDNLRRIAADEQMHAEIFAQLYHRYC